ncbi:MAG: ECF RNA polymerase sigma factor SigW [bacterium]|nr:ECF RNA polymerase sigma factor SigW [bacterium]
MANDEKELIRRLQAGETSAFRELVENHKRALFNLAYDLLGNAQDAEDISQEAFIKVYHSIGDFRGDARLGSWMYRIVVNLCLNRRRKKAWSEMELRESFEDDATHAPTPTSDHEANPEKTTEAEMIRQHLRRALDLLSPQQKTIFVLRHDDDLPLAEISKILKISEGTVKSQLFRALRKLQEELAFYKADFVA